jgi:hypothetical protein
MGTPAELAREVAGRQRLEVELAPEDIAAASAALDLMPGLVADAPDAARTEARGAEGVRLTIAGASRDTIPDVIVALVRAGVRIYRVSPQGASLEDVYFALHERSAGRADQ